MKQSKKNPQNYYKEDELLIKDINIDQRKTSKGNVVNTYIVIFVSATSKEEFGVTMPPASNRWHELVNFIFNVDDIFDPDLLIGYIVDAKVFYNQQSSGEYEINTAYYKVPKCIDMVLNFFSQPHPDWTKDQFEYFKQRWAYLDYIKETFDEELPSWLIEKQKWKDKYFLWK